MTKVLKAFYLLTLSLAAGCSSAYIPLEDIRVIDGDTIRAEAKGKEEKIRLASIDAPEMDQPFGVQSRNFLIRLLDKKDITVVLQEKRSYGRLVGEIYANGKSANTSMIKFGFAWVSDKYVKDSSFLYEHQDQAKTKNLGLWQAKDPIAPWVWRKQK